MVIRHKRHTLNHTTLSLTSDKVSNNHQMAAYFRLAVTTCMIWLVSGQYHAQYRNNNDQQQQQQYEPQVRQQQPVRLFAPDPYTGPTTPRPVILSHKQQLTHDGGFNYAFAADNGLQQGESIAPDGTRTGTYSYLDPSGKQITVKYTAGKEGFRILEGDHIPRQPPAAPAGDENAQQQEDEAEHQPHYLSATGINAGPQTFAKASQSGYYRPEPVQVPQVNSPLPRYLTYKNPSADANAIQPEPEYNDAPGSPHSFGNGYAFEFGG